MSRSAFIDLTTSPTDSRDEIRPRTDFYNSRPSPIQFHVSENSHDSKRRRLNSGAAAGPSTFAPGLQRTSPDSDDEGIPDVEAIDLTEVRGSNALASALSKQREDAIKAQHSGGDETGRSVLTSYKCPVCMDTLVDATTTVCGHLFCHKCIIDTLRFSEERRPYEQGKTARGNCPVCRKVLTKSDTPGPRRNLVPLKLKLKTKKRR